MNGLLVVLYRATDAEYSNNVEISSSISLSKKKKAPSDLTLN